MNFEQAMEILSDYSDPVIRHAANAVQHHDNNQKVAIKKAIEALSELRAGIKYMTFDLQCTRQERDELKSKLEN
jgi:hypothetical protein